MSDDIRRRVEGMHAEEAARKAADEAERAAAAREMTPLLKQMQAVWVTVPELQGTAPPSIEVKDRNAPTVDTDEDWYWHGEFGESFVSPIYIRWMFGHLSYNPRTRTWAYRGEVMSESAAFEAYKNAIASWIIHDYARHKELMESMRPPPQKQTSGCAILLAPLLLGPLAGIGFALLR